jgi:sec-independent protein translocase protein TatB
MFDIGAGELLVIGVVALIVIGPKELPAVLRQAGKFTSKMRQMAGEFRSQFDEAMRESELHEAKKQIASLNPMNAVDNQIQDVNAAINAKVEMPSDLPVMNSISAPIDVQKTVKKRASKPKLSEPKIVKKEPVNTVKKTKSTKQLNS